MQPVSLLLMPRWAPREAANATAVTGWAGLGWAGSSIVMMGLLAGCQSHRISPDEAASHIDSPKPAATRPHLGTEASRSHDFGPVLGRPGRTLSQTYRITNDSSHPIALTRAVNGKPCCGDVAFRPTQVAPGQTATLEVVLRVGGALGPLSHRAIVETDDPAEPALVFTTTADVRPPVRIEEEPRGATAPVGDPDARRHFVVIASGTGDEPPMDLNDSAIRSALAIRWEGPTVERRLEGGVVERSRPFSVPLGADGDPGPRSETIALVSGSETLLTYPVHWTVEAAIRATPAGVFGSASSRDPTERRVLLRSADGRSFRITGVETALPGVEAEPEGETAGATQVVRVVLTPCEENAGRPGELTITTDHPEQTRVTIALFVPNAIRSAPDGGPMP